MQLLIEPGLVPDIGLSYLNELRFRAALRSFRRCCGSSSWCLKMVTGRPYANRKELMRFSELKFRSLSESEWMEAFAHHPRIGELKDFKKDPDTSAWAADEQRQAVSATEDVISELAKYNDRYFRRHGYSYIVCATDVSTADILKDIVRRLKNDAHVELEIASSHQRKITRLRLEKLLKELGEEQLRANARKTLA